MPAKLFIHHPTYHHHPTRQHHASMVVWGITACPTLRPHSRCNAQGREHLPPLPHHNQLIPTSLPALVSLLPFLLLQSRWWQQQLQCPLKNVSAPGLFMPRHLLNYSCCHGYNTRPSFYAASCAEKERRVAGARLMVGSGNHNVSFYHIIHVSM